MATKRTPTLKQLFNTWKRYKKIQSQLTQIQHELNSMAQKIDYATELIRDEDNVYRVTAKGRYGCYEIEQIACAEELNNLLTNS
jgi:hypothetical protein